MKRSEVSMVIIGFSCLFLFGQNCARQDFSSVRDLSSAAKSGGEDQVTQEGEADAPPADEANPCMMKMKLAQRFKLALALDGDESKHVQICHVPPGNPSAMHTIVVGAPGARAHLAQHNDLVGDCGAAPVEQQTCLD